MKGQREKCLAGRRAAGGGTGIVEKCYPRWEPAARDKKVLKGGEDMQSWERAEGFIWWVYERIVELFAERAVALSGRLGGAGLILRMAVNKWCRQRRSRGEKTTGDVKTKEVLGGGGKAEVAFVKQETIWI